MAEGDRLAVASGVELGDRNVAGGDVLPDGAAVGAGAGGAYLGLLALDAGKLEADLVAGVAAAGGEELVALGGIRVEAAKNMVADVLCDGDGAVAGIGIWDVGPVADRAPAGKNVEAHAPVRGFEPVELGRGVAGLTPDDWRAVARLGLPCDGPRGRPGRNQAAS